MPSFNLSSLFLFVLCKWLYKSCFFKSDTHFINYIFFIEEKNYSEKKNSIFKVEMQCK